MTPWISDPDACARFLCASKQALALDTEFMRVNTYWPELALVQLAAGSEAVLVDPLAFTVTAQLAPVLADPTRIKIMHAASEDLGVLARYGATTCTALFDTQIAASFAGLGAGVGYRALVQALCGVVLPKDETRSDWRRRPLSTTQLAYAVADVTYLPALHGELEARLAQRQMRDWCAEDCARMAQTMSRAEAIDPQPHWQLGGAARLPLECQARLRRVLHERERIARDLDRPLRWVLDDAAAYALARLPAPSDAEIAALLAQQRSFPQRERGAFAAFVRVPVSALEWADTVPAPAALEAPERKRVEQLRDAIATRAQELDLPPGLLAPRRLLEAHVRSEHPPELDGWRSAILKDLLA